ncbi:MAG: caspase family protein [Burkholderiales bacterium]|jgi:hypothetical protein
MALLWIARLVAWSFIALLGVGSAAQATERHALLIGVGQYKGPPPGATWQAVTPLEGPPHDIVAMRNVLVERWRFKPESVRTLVNEQATRSAILAALRALKTRSKPGDEVLIYFSGHGTSWLDDNSASLNLASDSGAWAPYDFTLDPALTEAQRGAALLRGDLDLKPIFRELDDGGRLLWVISDSCFSGSLSRSVAAAGSGFQLPQRLIALPLRRDHAELVARLERAAASQVRNWPYRQAAFLLASAAAEPAIDINSQVLSVLPTVDGKPHGAMTDALLRVLLAKLPADFDGNGLLSLHEVQVAVSDFMSQKPYGHAAVRAPGIAEDGAGAATRSLLGAPGAALKPATSSAALTVAPIGLHLNSGIPAEVRKALQGVPSVQIFDQQIPERTLFTLLPSDKGLRLATLAGDTMLRLPGSDLGPLRLKLQQLHFTQALRALGQAGQRNALGLSAEPSTVGGNRVIGQSLRFALLPDREATLLLLNVDADGLVSVLYPYDRSEMARVPGQSPVFLPALNRPAIVVQEPVGIDQQFAIAFDKAPEGLERLLGASKMPVDDPRVRLVQRWLQEHRGAYTFSVGELRTLPAQ